MQEIKQTTCSGAGHDFAEKKTVRLNLASGTDHRPDWINLDIVAWEGYPPPDVFWDARSGKIPFEDDSAAEIYMGYTLLHLQPRYRPALLAEVRRVLSSTGILTVGEVDMVRVMTRWLADPSNGGLSQLIWGELGAIHGMQMAEWDTHYYGYSEETLKRELASAGFIDLQRIFFQHPDVWWELTIRGGKTG